MTSLRILELLFDDVLTDMIVGYTTFYSHREKEGTSFEITNGKIHLSLSMELLSGCHKLSDWKMYGEAAPDTFV